STLKRIGKTIFLGYIKTLFICLIFVALICLPFFNWNYTTSVSGGNAFSQIFQMFLNIFPNNIIEPFSSGNTLQIIFIAFIIGIALIFLGKKTTSVARAIEQINYIIQFITEFISKLVPFFTFNALLIMIWTSTVDSFLSMWKLFALLIGVIIIVTALLIGYCSLKQKTNFLSLTKKGLPTLISAITTASSAAAFGMNIKSSTEEFGIDKSLVAFSIPLGMVLFKITTAISYILLAYFYAEFFEITVTLDWFVLVIVISGVLAMATPPIPGGATISYTILFTQFLSSGGSEIISLALAMTVTIDVFLDFITTGFDQFLLPFALLNPASKIDLLDKNVLRSKKTHNKEEK
ncbi:MAG: cation:dicarboxylase symporter family transporter, partial [Firmicutes bacterium]|nr:cation:dicarboxylase symporter family transporter [Candidatus Caballimonas caccae]